MRLRSLPTLIVLVAGILGGTTSCATSGANGPLAGDPHPTRSEAAYWIFADDEWLHVRVTSGERGHRFQGSVTAQKGTLGALALDRPALAERVAAQGASIQFDLEPGRGGEEGFRVHLDRGCARFDLYLDGAHRPERVRLGGNRLRPREIPFERCP